MKTTLSRYGSLAMALMVCTALGGCKSKNNYASSDTMGTAMTPGGGTLDTTAAGGAVGNASSMMPDWTDTDILAYLDAANQNEINAGNLAASRAANSTVKAFGRQMVEDHSAMLKQGQALAKKLSIDVATSTKDDVKDVAKDGQDQVQDLTKKDMGKDWDEDYIEKQIDGHQEVADKINDFMKSAQNAEVRTMLQRALPKVQAHLKKAQDIKNTTLS